MRFASMAFATLRFAFARSRFADVRLDEVRLAEVAAFAEVRQRFFRPPCVPNRDALPEEVEMLWLAIQLCAPALPQSHETIPLRPRQVIRVTLAPTQTSHSSLWMTLRPHTDPPTVHQPAHRGARGR